MTIIDYPKYISQCRGSYNNLISIIQKEAKTSFTYYEIKKLIESDEDLNNQFLASVDCEDDKLEQTLISLSEDTSEDNILIAVDCAKYLLKNRKYSKDKKQNVIEIKTENVDLSSYSDEDLEKMLEVK